jgi:hypothetical protein
MIFLFGCGVVKYERYVAKDEAIGISCDQVAGWRAIETRGSVEKYAQVQFLEPTRPDKTLVASLSVDVMAEGDLPAEARDAAGYLDRLLNRRSRLKDYRPTGRSKGSVQGQPASIAEFAYQTPTSFAIKPAFVAVRERLVVFKRSGRMYVVTYFCLESRFSSYRAALSRLLKTISFQN